MSGSTSYPWNPRDESFRISWDRKGQLVQPPRFTDGKAGAQRGGLTCLESQTSILDPDLSSSSESKPRDLLPMHPMALLPIMHLLRPEENVSDMKVK